MFSCSTNITNSPSLNSKHLFFLKVPNDDKYVEGSGPKKYLQHIPSVMLFSSSYCVVCLPAGTTLRQTRGQQWPPWASAGTRSVFVFSETVYMLWAAMMDRCISVLWKRTTLRQTSGRRYTHTHTQGNWMHVQIIFYKYICMSALVCRQAAGKRALNHDLVNNKVVKQTHSLSLTFLQLLSKPSRYVSTVM